jgi:hypothetical protein
MTQQLTKLIERVKTWPAWRQQDVARMIEAMEEGGTEVYHLSDEERLLVDEGLDQSEAWAIRARRGHGEVLESPSRMKVRYIPRAQDDVAEICEGIASSNPNRAQRVEHAIRAAAELLGRKPGRSVAKGA